MNVIVFGGTSGIGAAVTDALRWRGDAVTTVGRSDKADLRADITQPISLELIGAIRDADAAVLAAGIGAGKPLALQTDAEIANVINTDLTAQLILMRCCLRGWMERGSGSIVAVSSVAAKVGISGLVVYSAAKAGLEAAVRAAAREYGRFHLRLNCVAPGYIETPMTADLTDRIRGQITKRTPGGRVGCPEDVAGAVLLLLDNPHINGTVITVDGGYSA